ncbi:MAG: glycosyltransferase family 2 protein [Planctomycetes bacterium]|nr:glycosyltransferase family 2 protein [Planctomycetota bacterium]
MNRRAAPLVSIITPAYNAERFLAQTVASVQAQQHSNWEMLVVDDHSRDGTLVLARSLARTDDRIRVLRNPRNLGPGLTRDHGAGAARGRFVAFLDSDDLWPPAKLRLHLEFMVRARAAFSCTAYRRFRDAGDGLSCVVGVPLLADRRALLRNNTVATSTVLIDRSHTGGFHLQDTHYDDFALWLALARRGHPAHGLPLDLMRYRIALNSFSGNKLRSARKVLEAYVRVQRLGLADTAWCFFNYACTGILKHRNEWTSAATPDSTAAPPVRAPV